MTSGVFVDTNILVRHLAGDQKAKKLIDQIEIGEIRGYINQIVVSEVVFVYMRLLTKLDAKTLKRNHEIICKIDLEPVYEILSIFVELQSSNLITVESRKIMSRYGLLPNDALIAATCKHYGIKKIATFDEDFRRVDFLQVVEL
jgi:predicted nucleic acid-binding protein